MLFLIAYVIGMLVMLLGIITALGCGVFWKTANMSLAIRLVITGSLIALIFIIPALSFLIELRKFTEG